ncbi:MAG: OB-fold nucleic acid binding domain-containing protein, partial [Oscillospiraceae bacterium]|nr:OB-fold nucleic acid binding domain-containing protein [Oscillospiraceae bacterium]
MTQNRTHTCGALRAENAGERVRLVGWMENVREVGGSLVFVVLRDFYGTTQLKTEDPEMIAALRALNKESTIAAEGVVQLRSSRNPKLPTGDVEIVLDKLEVLG